MNIENFRNSPLKSELKKKYGDKLVLKSSIQVNCVEIILYLINIHFVFP